MRSTFASSRRWVHRSSGSAGLSENSSFLNQAFWIEFSGLDYDATRNPDLMAKHLHPEHLVLEHWHRCVQTGTAFELEARLRSKTGEFRWFMMRSVPLQDDEGRIVKWFGTSTDIHDSKLTQLELKRTNRDLEHFAYSASHDLQEPLRGIKIFSELLHRGYADKLDGTGLEFLGNVRTSATRMEALLRDLLLYAQASTVEKQAEMADANEAVRAALVNVAGAVADTAAKVHFDPLPSVCVQAVQLQQVFQNLIRLATRLNITVQVFHQSFTSAHGAKIIVGFFLLPTMVLASSENFRRRSLDCSSVYTLGRSTRAQGSDWLCASGSWNAMMGGSGSSQNPEKDQPSIHSHH